MNIIITIIVLVLDQISKLLLSNIDKEIMLIPNFFHLTYKQNSGAAFGLFSNQTPFLILISLIGLIIICRYIKTFKKNKRNIIAFSVLIAGIIGNLIDRVFLDYVRDFFDLYLFKYKIPTFNLADTMILLGVILLIIAIIKGEDEIESK